MKNVIIACTVPLLIFFSSCSNIPEWMDEAEVYYNGTFQKIMKNELDGRLALDSLKGYTDIYGLGAMEGLQGEILLWNGELLKSSVVDSALNMNYDFSEKATLMVYSAVSEWETIDLGGIKTIRELEQNLTKELRERKMNIRGPWAIQLEGMVEILDWHVIDWDKADSVHTMQKHKTAGLKGRIANEKVQILGFFSLDHRGHFTHKNSHFHFHFRKPDGSLSGHADGFIMGEDMKLKIPKIDSE